MRSDVRDDSKLPDVQQDSKLPPDQELGNAPLVLPEVKEIKVPRNPKLSVVPQDPKLPPGQELGNAPLAPRDVRTPRVPRDLKMLVVLQDPKLPPDWAWCRAPLSPPLLSPPISQVRKDVKLPKSEMTVNYPQFEACDSRPHPPAVAPVQLDTPGAPVHGQKGVIFPLRSVTFPRLSELRQDDPSEMTLNYPRRGDTVPCCIV